LSGFPFDFAQGGEPVEPRISSSAAGLVQNDELRDKVEWGVSIKKPLYNESGFLIL
jgi:hypothetical protein